MGSNVRCSKILNGIASIMLRIWAYSSLILFVCFILYCLYGGIYAFLLLVFAATGKRSNNQSISRYSYGFSVFLFRYRVPRSRQLPIQPGSTVALEGLRPDPFDLQPPVRESTSKMFRRNDPKHVSNHATAGTATSVPHRRLFPRKRRKYGASAAELRRIVP